MENSPNIPPISSFDKDPNNRPLAESKIKGPAISLIVTAAIGIMVQIGGIVMQGAMAGLEQGLPTDLEGEQAEMFQRMMTISQSMGIVGNIIVLVVAGLIIFGSVKMMKLENRGLAIATSIVALVPCISPCCVLGIPFGIWALVVLNDDVVKSEFN